MNKKTQKELLNIVKRNYDEIAEEFNETRKKILWPELIKLSESVRTGDEILDVGCGNGRLLEAFTNKDIKYLGVDSSEKLINLAMSRYISRVKSRYVNFIVGDILDLGKIPQIGFNYVFCVAVLQHIPGRDLQVTALKQLKNKVNNNDKIIITVWNLWSQMKYKKLIYKFALLRLIGKNKMAFGDIVFNGFNQKSKRYYHAFRMGELKRIIKKSGLKIERIYKDKYNYYAVLGR